MESLERSKSVIALGKRIVADLAKDEDLTSEWMAHLIAERMDAVEQAASDLKAIAEDACVREILRLWKHRYAGPPRMNPLRYVEPIARTLAALDPEGTGFQYNRDALGLAKGEDCKTPNDWLKLALQIDRTAKDLIKFSLQMGAEEAFASPEFKAALSDALGSNADIDFEVRLVRFVLDEDDAEEQLARAADAIILKKIARLESLATLSSLMAGQLKQKLSDSSDLSQDSDELDI